MEITRAINLNIAFNYGFLGVTIKEINMLTSMMSVLLVGLGVDYGIQIVTNFNTYRFLAGLGKAAHNHRIFTIIAGIIVTVGLLFTALTANRMNGWR